MDWLMNLARAASLFGAPAALLSLAAPSLLAGQGRTAGGPPLDVTGLEVAGFEDFRTGAGRMEAGVWTVDLEARPVAWYPWGPDARGLRAHVLTEVGEPPRVPGPMIRVSAGTPVAVRLRNTFPDTLLVRGLWDRSGEVGAGPGGALRGRPAVVAPGATAEVRFTPTAPGTYFWMGRVVQGGWSDGPPPALPRRGNDRSMVGALVVDPAGEVPPPDERVFLISHWADPSLEGSFAPASRFMINGRSWPATERLSYAQGDTVRWRVLNLSGRIHPMHLHGFYFSVDARGDQGGEAAYAEEERQLAVTETLAPGQSARLTWVPSEPGNWIFHCHLMRHMSWPQSAGLDEAPGGHPPPGAAGEDLMGGLVLGINVNPEPGYASSEDLPRRRLDLHITHRPGVFDEAAGYGFVLDEGTPPAADSIHFPGSPIVLTRGEPAEIAVHNRADVALGVHWHGLELESWADGVPGWSGYPDAVRSAVSPGDSFVVRMTPPRAGTFMYHAHSEPGHQLAQGLYGPFLVLEQGEVWNPETDRVFLLGSLGSGQDPPPAINGHLEPPPIELEANRPHRLRFMHISPDDDKHVRLLQGDEPVAWRAVAKDGADLPPALVQDGAADLRIDVGETYDFLWTPTPGEYTLRVVTTFDRGTAAFPREAPPPATQDITIRVRP